MRNDSENAKLLYELCGHAFKYVKPWGRFVVWDGQTWVQDQDRGYMLTLTLTVLAHLGASARTKVARAWAETSGNLGHRRAMVDLLRGVPECHAKPADFDQNRMLLTCANGTLDLETGEFRDSRPEDMLTSKCEVAYDATAKCPAWEKYLSESLPDPDIRGFMKRWLGYCLTGHVKERKFVVCWGEKGNNGKSLMFGVLKALLGDKYAWNAQPKLLLDNEYSEHSTIYASLCGKRLCMVSEIKVGRVWDEANVKLLTGGDPVNCRRMHEDEWVFEPTHKIMVATNPKPKVRDTSDAFWNRLVLVPWEVSFTGPRMDTGLKDKLLAELPGILNWMVEGCREWQEVGLQVPDKLTAAAQLYRQEEDQLGAMIDQCFIFEPNSSVDSGEVAAIVKDWCEQANMTHPFSMKAVSQRFRQGGADSVNSNSTRKWVGVRRRSALDREKRTDTNAKKPLN